MKHYRMPPARDLAPNVTPLIDVVMCLIIFYMLVAKIGINTGVLKSGIELPVSLQGIKLTDVGNTINLNVIRPPDGDFPLVSTLDPGTGQLVTIAVLEGSKHPLADFLTVMKGQNANFMVNIRADRELPYRFLEPVLIACNEAKVKTFNLAMRQPK